MAVCRSIVNLQWFFFVTYIVCAVIRNENNRRNNEIKGSVVVAMRIIKLEACGAPNTCYIIILFNKGLYSGAYSCHFREKAEEKAKNY